MHTPALRQPPLGVLRDDGSLDPARATEVPGELAVALYEHMRLSRALDERMAALDRDGAVSWPGGGAGIEATVVGAAAAMEDEDWIFPSPPDVAAALWRGLPLSMLLHHAFGTAPAASKGRSAPDSVAFRRGRIASASPLAGARIAHAVGLAWAARLRGDRVATMVSFEEAAAASADFHTGLNFAGVTCAPVVALCRSRRDAAGEEARGPRRVDVSLVAAAYGLEGIPVDGADVLAILTAVREARRRAVDGAGATIVEAIVPGVAQADPVVRMRRHVEARGLWTAEREERFVAEVGVELDAALAEAAGAKRPARSTIFDDVYAEPPWHLREQRRRGERAPWT